VDPLRGDIWDAPRAGDHPVVVLTINVLIPRLSAVTVAVVTGTEGPAQTHIPVASESGLTGHDVSYVKATDLHSYVKATDLHSVDKSRLRHRRGRLHPRELARLEEAIRVYLGLCFVQLP
jgi:mRNA interferase MazF